MWVRWRSFENTPMADNEKKWFALYTKPRWEKKVHRTLTQKNIEAYCPLNRIKRKWSDRIKTIEEPLFKSYVFVKVADADKTEVRYVDGVLNFVYWNGKPAIVKEEEIIELKKFLSEYDEVEVSTIDIKPADEVMLTTGVMMGATARVLRVLSKTMVEVHIYSLGFKITAKLDKKNLTKV
jgi:transcription antitermination factor NusG